MKYIQYLIEEITKKQNKFEEIHKDTDLIEKHKVPTLHTETLAYTKSAKKLNTKLWDDKKYGDLSDSTLTKIKKIHDNLDTAKKASQDFHVFSGVRRDPQELVKDSSGILHHPAFLSTTSEPDVALRFTKPINDINHVLRIKVRKGQNVGGYIANNSEHESEKEFLIKSNQVLHINQTPTDFINNEGKKIRIHDAIILNKKELDKEIEHPEIQSKLDFDERL